MSLYPKPSSSATSFATEFDILRASHKFLRHDNDPSESSHKTSWNDQLAQKYYDNLFREFAVCDLKHYKSGNFALRWRTEAEVLSGAGENTCGNTRCKHHTDQDTAVQLSTLELPFAYEEHGEHKSALVKVVLCPRCLKKLMWKRNKEKDGQSATPLEVLIEPGNHEDIPDKASNVNRLHRSTRSRDNRRGSEAVETESSIRRRSSRSRSPRDRRDAHRSRRQRSTP
ncbi:folate-sensitive fragile site protein Fra10Ac1-domain-containing protein [Russula aff. rugulosa BPL654]|nr:folate-sensitive fragile site protein Fra10Ac1-domain-containing protein [Russula aff. rugulosa BPL654]